MSGRLTPPPRSSHCTVPWSWGFLGTDLLERQRLSVSAIGDSALRRVSGWAGRLTLVCLPSCQNNGPALEMGTAQSCYAGKSSPVEFSSGNYSTIRGITPEETCRRMQSSLGPDRIELSDNYFRVKVHRMGMPDPASLQIKKKSASKPLTGAPASQSFSPIFMSLLLPLISAGFPFKLLCLRTVALSERKPTCFFREPNRHV